MSLLGGPLGGQLAATGLLGSMNPKTKQLTPEQEAAYVAWMQKIGHTPQAGYNVAQDLTGKDYDYRGFFAKHGAPLLGKGQHLTDEFKLPAHPTFSDESVYFNQMTKPFAGTWKRDGNGFVFVPFNPKLKKTVRE